MAFIVFKQIVIMFGLAAVGFCLYKGKLVSQEGSNALGKILIYVSLPAVILQGFLVDRTPEHIQGLLLSAAAAALTLVLSVVIAAIMFRKDAIASFSGAFSNPGFFGVPIVSACLGPELTFYMACYIAFLNLLQWSYGVSLLQRDDGKEQRQNIFAGLSFKRILTAPFMIAILAGLVLFFTAAPVPDVARSIIGYAAGLNTSLAMFVVGIYLAQSNLSAAIRNTRIYLVSLCRLVIIPLCTIALLYFVFPQSLGDMKLVILIAAACPVGSNVAVYASLYHKDHVYAVENVIVSTLFSVLTLPLIVRLGEIVFGI